MNVKLIKSPKKDKKFRVIFENGRHVDFGGAGYSDYTLHKDRNRMKRYEIRHKNSENWNKSGIYTAGFWSKWYLWHKPTKNEARIFIQKKFNIIIN